MATRGSQPGTTTQSASMRKRKRDEGVSAKTQDSQAPSEIVRRLLSSFEIENDDGELFRVVSHEPLPQDRRSIYAKRFPELQSGEVFACKCSVQADDDEDAEEDKYKGFVEHLVILTRTQEEKFVPRAFLTEDKISYEQVSPSQLVEYRFSEDDKWHLSVSTRECLESFRRSKFGSWKQQLLKTTCKATLRSLLALGPITRLYDRYALPTPEDELHLYETKDENGKTVHIPHPVSGLRVWDPEASSYAVIQAHLDGAPEGKEAVSEFWDKTLNELREAHGREFIDNLLEEGLKKLNAARARIVASERRPAKKQATSS